MEKGIKEKKRDEKKILKKSETEKRMKENPALDLP